MERYTRIWDYLILDLISDSLNRLETLDPYSKIICQLYPIMEKILTKPQIDIYLSNEHYTLKKIYL